MTIAPETASLEPNGYAWMKYSSQEKHSLAGLICTSLNLGKDKKERIIRALDLFYNRAIERRKNIQDADESLSLRCVDVIFIGIDSSAAHPQVIAKNDNIFYCKDALTKTQLTHSKKDRAPVLSPDKKHIAFIRKSNRKGYDPHEGSEDYPSDPRADQIWLIDIDGKNEKMIVKDYYPNDAGSYAHGSPETEKAIGFIDDKSICFSPDGKQVYFMTYAWIVEAAIHCVNIDGTNEHFVINGDILKIIDRGRYKGSLLISQGRLHLPNGPREWNYYLFTTDGKEIKAFGEELNKADLDFLYNQ